jgi:NADH:ubiquinone oxidoreductase subunit 6 (subunit J)
MLSAWLIIDAGLLCALLVFCIQAIRAQRLLASALWLASASAVLSIVFYALGGYQVAVFELSIGAGLVTVLFVFAISIAGEDAMHSRALPRPLAWGLAIGAVVLLSLLVPTIGPDTSAAQEPAFSVMLWHERGLDVLVQIVLLFAGVIGMLGVLSEEKAPLDQSVAAQIMAERDQELLDLQQQVNNREKEIV